MKKYFSHTTITLTVVLTLLALGPGMGLSAKDKPGRLKKPITFSVESLSLIRSADIKPERSAPEVYGDQIFIASSRKKLVVFDMQGKKVIKARLKFAPVAQLAVSGGKVFVGGDDGNFHCLSASSGEEIWSIPFKTIDFSPAAVAGNLVIFITAGDRALALSSDTGQYRWEYQHIRTDDLAVRGISRPLVMEGTVYLGFSGGSVASLELASGLVNWKTNAFAGEQFMDIDAALAADDTSVYASSVGGMMAAISRKTGKVYWTYNAGGMAGMALSGAELFLATDDAEIVSLDKVTGKVNWSTRMIDREATDFYELPTRPVVIDQQVVSVTRAGKVVVFDRNSGNIVALKKFYTDISSPAIGTGDDAGFLFFDNKGIIRLWP